MPASLSRATIIRGGCIKNRKQWVIEHSEIKFVDDMMFVELSRRHKMFSQFVGSNFAMMNRIMDQRNAKSDEIMHASGIVDSDPMAAMTASTDGSPPNIARRRATFEELTDVGPVKINVVTKDGVSHEVRVIPHWHQRSKLVIEFNEENMDLLTREPLESKEESWKPTFHHTSDVKWNTSRKSVYVILYMNGGWRHKHRAVAFDDHDDDQAAVDAAAQALQKWRNAKHEEPPLDDVGEDVDPDEPADDESGAAAAGAMVDN